MRFVETKTADQQSGLVLHRTRHLCMRQQTSVINAIRAHLRSLASSRRSDAMGLRNCSGSSPIPMPAKVAAIALANKIARMVWAMMAKCERYKEPVALAA